MVPYTLHPKTYSLLCRWGDEDDDEDMWGDMAAPPPPKPKPKPKPRAPRPASAAGGAAKPMKLGATKLGATKLAKD